MAELLNRLPMAVRWILMVAVLVLLIAALALVVSQLQAEAETVRFTWLEEILRQAEQQPCLRDAADFDQTNICTADDVELTVLEVVEGPETCIPGEEIEVKLAATLQSRSSARYDIGFYIADDDGNALDRGTTCFRDYLHPVSTSNEDLDLNGGFGPFYNGELAHDDDCADVQREASSYYILNENETITITCQDSDGNGIADVGTVISWDINPTTDCSDEGDTVPDQTSKCRQDVIELAGIYIPQTAQMELVKSLVPSEDEGLFNLHISDIGLAEDVGDLGTTEPITVSAGTVEEPGETHQVSETAGTDTTLPDYAIALECVHRGTTDSVGTGSGPGPHGVTIQPDDDIVCTFTNTRRESGITIRKETDPAGTSGDFAFASNDDPVSFSLAHGEEQEFTGLTIEGTYAFTETVPIGWGLKEIVCEGQDSSEVAYGETDVSIVLAEEETILCTFVDEPVASITVTKSVDPETVMEPSGRVTYTVAVENDSVADVPVEIISMEDDPYGDLTDSGNAAIGRSTCQLGEAIAQGDTYTCTFRAEVSGKAGELVTDTVTVEAQIPSDNGLEEDVTGAETETVADAESEDEAVADEEAEAAPADNGGPIQASASATVTITAAPPIVITVTKTADPEVAYVPSDTIEYLVDVTNGSGEDLPVRLQSLVDDIYGDPTDTGNTAIENSTCTAGAVIEPGASYSCTFEAVVEGEVGFMVTDTITATVTDRAQREVTGSDDATVTMVAEPPDTGGEVSAPILALGLAMLGSALLLAGTAIRAMRVQPRR